MYLADIYSKVLGYVQWKHGTLKMSIHNVYIINWSPDVIMVSEFVFNQCQVKGQNYKAKIDATLCTEW